MADQLKQIKEFPQKPDFGDDDLLLIQGQGTTYNVRGQTVKKYAEDSAKPQVELAKKEAQAAAAAADRAEDAIQHPAIPDPNTGNWLVWDQVSESYQQHEPPLRAEGQDFEIRGYYPTLEDLETAVPEPGVGAAYGIGTEEPYDIYVWDAVHGVWVNNGALQGPRGEQGPEGPQGPAGPPGAEGAGIPNGGTAGQFLAKASAENQDVEWKDPPEGVGRSMAGQQVEPTQGTTVTAREGAEIFNDYRARTYGPDEGSTTILAQTGNIASGTRAHAEGCATTANGTNSHAEGFGTIASGNASHAEGGGFIGSAGSIASAYGAHAEGTSTTASGGGAHSEGRGTVASGVAAHAEGQNTIANKDYSHAEGYGTKADGLRAHAEGYSTQATGQNSHSEGYKGIAEGSASHVEGGLISGKNSNKASGYAAHAEGSSTLAIGNQSHAEGEQTTASGANSHAQGYLTTASNSYAHSEGYKTVASALAAHAEGVETTARGGWGTHAEGQKTVADAYYSHAEGSGTVASGNYSHAEGYNTKALGEASHAEGENTEARERLSHAAGLGTIADRAGETVVGWYNALTTAMDGAHFVVGSGASNGRSTGFRVNSYGKVYGTGAYNSSGADYAELFEWADGNLARTDRTGRFVTLEGERIRLAGPEDDYILGIISGSPSVVGDVYDDQWQGMYLTDIFGRPIIEEAEVPAVTEEVEVPIPSLPENREDQPAELETRKETRVVIPAYVERRRKLNPAYDNSQTYMPRTERPEWAAVGMLGKLVAVDDGSCRVNGWAAVGEGGAATNSEERTKYRVMARLDERHVRILIL